MKITEKLPDFVTWQKVSEFATTKKTGVHLVTSFFLVSDKSKVNPLLFYVFCFVRSEAFRSRNWYDNWDCANLGEKYATSKDGIRAALLEFEKFDDTSLLQEEDQVLALYAEACEFCKGIIYQPVPEPEPPKPPPPPPQPEPEPEPEPQKPEPDKPDNPTNWKRIILIGGPIVLAILGAAGLVLPIPGFIRVAIEAIVKALMAAVGG